MYQLLIVEDEKWEREGLRDFINWSEWEIELIGCACDGIEGLAMAEQYRPDIIMTDIMMPRMDGLRMSEEIRSFLPDAKIIVLSGYEDFQYAKQSIGFHACSYILKPVEKNSLEELLSVLLRDLGRKIREDKALETLKRQWSEYAEANESRLLYNCLERKSDLNRIRELAPFSGWNRQGRKIVAIVYLYRAREKPPAPPVLNDEENVLQTIRSLVEKQNMFYLFSTPREEVVLCLDAPRSLSDLKQEIRPLKEMIHQKLGIETILSTGEAGEGLSGLSRSYAQAKEAGRSRFLADYGELLLFDEIREEVPENWETVKPQILYIKSLIDKIAYDVHKHDLENALILTDEFLSALRKCRRLDRILLDSLIAEILKHVPLSRRGGADREEKMYSGLFASDSLPRTRELLTGFLKGIAAGITEQAVSGNGEIADKVIMIIEERYSEELDLQAVSEAIQLSPYYIGSLFKNFTGKGFNQYLQDYRISKAEAILRTDEITIGALAEAVGIRSQSYFCSLFKKKTGLSPGEYKDAVTGGEGFV